MLHEPRKIINRAKNRLKQGDDIRVFNVFELLKPSVIKIVRQSGYNMIKVDAEHILHDPETLNNFLVMARDNELSPAVTIPTVSRPLVSTLLDAGAQGICLAHAETLSQVEELVKWMKYPPIGERALAPTSNAEYIIDDPLFHCKSENKSTLLILKIESKKGVENAESLLSNEWVDAIIFGPGDLAADMGFHGQWKHNDVIKTMQTVCDIALEKGKAVEAPSLATNSSEYTSQREAGYQIFGPHRGTEYDLLRKGALEAISYLLPENK
ncbi:MAG: hypothetical protein CL780_02625 [Chloroflexi bacterium]|nr:hypothetical protein [Chloroflexota bacterium]|tara:strand:+ start:1199 stop:2002 length:804 start_codon:yes stop_codon:yes gene_type:complete